LEVAIIVPYQDVFVPFQDIFRMKKPAKASLPQGQSQGCQNPLKINGHGLEFSRQGMAVLNLCGLSDWP
jgi:hypothetical protein